MLIRIQIFENTWLQYQEIKRSDEESQTKIFGSLQKMDEIYDHINNQNNATYKQTVERDRIFVDKTEKDIETIRTSLSSGLKKVYLVINFISRRETILLYNYGRCLF